MHSCARTLALPQLTETRRAAASINGALCSLLSQMPSPSSPHAERALCVHHQPRGRSKPGNKTTSLSPGRDWCPPAGERVGDSSARQRVKAASLARTPGKSQGRRTHVSSPRVCPWLCPAATLPGDRGPALPAPSPGSQCPPGPS